MKCLRCGYCCHHCMVIIVDDPEKGLTTDNLTEHMGQGLPCKHLRGRGIGEFECSIHHYDWYKETPCYRHDQIGKPDDPCRMGQYILGRKDNLNYGEDR